MKLKKDRVISIVLLTFMVAVAVAVSRFKAPVINSTGDPGAKLFPMLGVILVSIGSVGLFFQSNGSTEEPFMSREEIKRLIKLAAGFVLYGACLGAAGYLIATPVMLFLVMGLMAQGNPVKLTARIAYSIGITAILYLVFTYALRFRLPQGILGGF